MLASICAPLCATFIIFPGALSSQSVGSKSMTFTDFKTWSLIKRSVTLNGEMELLSPPIDPGMEWKELVASWNASPIIGKTLEVSVRTVQDTSVSPFFSFGTWNCDPQEFGMTSGPRTSVDSEVEGFSMQTDTLVAKSGVRKIEVIIRSPGILTDLSLKRLTLSFWNETKVTSSSEKHEAWGKLVEVPQKCQGDYPNGSKICSPTSTSMILNWWALSQNRPEWAKDVPDTVAGTYDIAWKGTGNWPFNVAYAGSLGLVGEIHRLNSMRDLEALIASRIPVACSVSYGKLKGGSEREPNDGHIVVLVGFTESGDPIFNDPGLRQVRQTYKRGDFLRAWEESNNTIYLIHPEDYKRPKLSIDP